VVGSDARPLVVCDSSGTPIDVVLENEKGFTKSIESGTLWSIHPDTGRLLPHSEGARVTIEDRGAWYCATLGGAEPATPGEPAAISSGSDTPAALATPAASAGDIGAVLSWLVAVIRDRRRKMPEGSYTTHLFSAGKEKIRKKTGEEAVELILAGTRAELTSETADLLYHLLVLLEVEGISLDEVGGGSVHGQRARAGDDEGLSAGAQEHLAQPLQCLAEDLDEVGGHVAGGSHAHRPQHLRGELDGAGDHEQFSVFHR